MEEENETCPTVMKDQWFSFQQTPSNPPICETKITFHPLETSQVLQIVYLVRCVPLHIMEAMLSMYFSATMTLQKSLCKDLASIHRQH